jgi:hypothetical protein
MESNIIFFTNFLFGGITVTPPFLGFVDTQFPIGDVTRWLNSWFDCSEYGYLHKEEDNKIEERPGVSRRGHSDA